MHLDIATLGLNLLALFHIQLYAHDVRAVQFIKGRKPQDHLQLDITCKYVNATMLDTIHLKGNKFVTGVNIKAIID